MKMLDTEHNERQSCDFDDFRISRQDFFSGFNEPPALELEGRSTENKLIMMSPDNGAICYLAADGTTIRISHYGD